MGRVIVVGAGVVGLSCAVRLLEAGHRVDVLARDLPLETTSAVAAAVWSPYVDEQPHVVEWARRSYDAFVGRRSDAESGIVLRSGVEASFGEMPEPWWSAALPESAGLERIDRLDGGLANGWSYTSPVVEMGIYLPWLARRVEALGGTVSRHNLSALPSAPGVLVVNAAGIGARHLADDPSITPVRGQIVLTTNPGIDQWLIEAETPTYVVPRSRDVVVGGTAQRGDWSRTADSATAEDILRRATALVPQLAQASVLRHRVGLRPARPQVRLEREGDVIHCYGHGGCGVTVSWGCADDVVALADGGLARD